MTNEFKSMVKDSLSILKMVSEVSKSIIPFIIINNVLKATLPYVNLIFSSLILDHLVIGSSKETILQDVYLMVTMNLILGLLLALFTRLVNVKSEYVNLSMKSKIAEKSLTMDFEQLESKEHLELLHKAHEGMNSHGGISSFCHHLGNMLNQIITLIYAVIILSSLFLVSSRKNLTVLEKLFNSPYLTILLFVFLFSSIFINFKIMKKISTDTYEFFERNVENNRKFAFYMSLGNNYNFGKDIRIYNMSKLIEEEMNHAFSPAEKQMKLFAKNVGKYSGYIEIVNQGIIFLTYVYVGIKAILGFIGVGSILRLVGALTKFNSSLSIITNNYTQIDLQRRYLNNYCQFLKIENKKYQGSLPIEKRDDFEFELEFKNVSFHYPNSEDMILKNVSLKLNVGHKMAIVGKNGAGKTTFIKLLCRLYDPTDGEILLNGINIKKYDYNEYQRILSVVFQDFKLFSFEIGQNVASNLHFDETKTWEVLEQAGVSERISKMKEGLNTTIYQNEENGIEISGGEAQKIAIARALYKDAPLVILDEPTSALDPISEYEIYSKFDHLVTGKTSIYISHRMSSCRFCDHIVVFDDGQICQVGSHEELMNDKDGLYNKLWTSQAKYYNI